MVSHVLTLSMPDEGYSRNASCALYLISTFFIYMYELQKQKEIP